MNQIVGNADIAMIVFDTLRYDVAEAEYAAGGTPHLAQLFPEGWEKRHSPGNFTYAAHQAFFAGFLPTPADPVASQERLFASSFHGSETSGENTKVFETATIQQGLSNEGYQTICIGGVGFFNRQTPLSCVLPDLFDQSHWSPQTGVTDPDSTRHQVAKLKQILGDFDTDQRLFVYINISAIHQPNCHYIAGQTEDDLHSHAAALRYVDQSIPDLFSALTDRSDVFVIATSDHGTLYGEDGYNGHRIGHPAVYTVPYMENYFTRTQ